MKKQPAINDLLKVMAKLRSPQGCPWDREQSHQSLRWHAVEEVYELIDAIEAKDDHEMEEELGDLLQEYERNRDKYPTFESFFPEVVTFLNEYANKG